MGAAAIADESIIGASSAKKRVQEPRSESAPDAQTSTLLHRNEAQIRAKTEQIFAMMKQRSGFGGVRHQGLEKNASRRFVAIDLACLYLACNRIAA